MLGVMQWCVLGWTPRRASAPSSRHGLFAGPSGDEVVARTAVLVNMPPLRPVHISSSHGAVPLG